MKEILVELFRLKRRSLIAIAVLLVINVILYIVISAYQEPGLTNARHQWNDLRGRVAAISRGDVTSAYRQGKSDLERLKARIPQKREFPRILGEIMEAAASSNVVLGGVTYKPKTVKDENLLAYGVTLSMTGSYAAVKSFLADMQKSRELLVVDNITLTNSDPFEESVTMDLQLTIYLQGGV